MEKIWKLKKIDLSQSTEVFLDLRPLEKLRDLQVLNISNTQIEDISPIKTLTGLRVLRLSGTNVKDFDDIAQLL